MAPVGPTVALSPSMASAFGAEPAYITLRRPLFQTSRARQRQPRQFCLSASAGHRGPGAPAFWWLSDEEAQIVASMAWQLALAQEQVGQTEHGMHGLSTAHSSLSSSLQGPPPGLEDQASVRQPAATDVITAVPDLVRHAERGEVSEVSHLLNQGVDPNCADDLGFTALQCAAKKGHSRVVALLLEHGAAANLCTLGWLGESPLHFACKYGHVGTTRLLLRHGADPSLQTREGRTPGDYAQERNHTEVIEVLNMVAR